MTAPLVARGRALGAITFVTVEPGRRYGPADLELAEELARRTAIAADNARLYGEAQRAVRARDEFLATVSHELRTPLTSMLGWARLLRDGALDPAASARAIETLDRNARALGQLIQDLLDVSRIVTGRLRVDVRPVDLAAVIDAAVEAVHLAAEAREIRLVRALDPSVGPVTGDADRLQQVVWNLLSNAIKFTPRGGRVEVRLDRGADVARITVTDSGRGIAPADLPFVFARFWQAESSTTRTYGGLGIGLAIVRHIVELHGGTIRAESEGEGRGAKFTVELPLVHAAREAEAGAPAERPGEPAAPAAEIEDVRVLVVDDEPDTRDLVAFALERCGARVEKAASAEAAIRAITRDPPDVLIADIGMPGEDGYGLIRRVRALPPERGGRVPAAALTAYAGEETRERALAAGFERHVPKPVAPEELAAVVAALVRRERGGS
jgi:signal transduction histidine kinase/ActR/RegA family two-component response regulator